jgi:sulfur carrier protein
MAEHPDAALRVNGRLDVADAGSVAELLQRHGIDPATRFIAVAVNGAVVRRGDWTSTRLAPGDAVEIVRPFAGG